MKLQGERSARQGRSNGQHQHGRSGIPRLTSKMTTIALVLTSQLVYSPSLAVSQTQLGTVVAQNDATALQLDEGAQMQTQIDSGSQVVPSTMINNDVTNVAQLQTRKAIVLEEPRSLFQSAADTDAAESLAEDDNSSDSSSQEPGVTLVQQVAEKTPGGETTADSAADEPSSASKWLQERPYLLIILAVASVMGCCFFSQVLLRYSKQCNLSLNRYYIRKRFQKQKMMTETIQESRKLRQNRARQRRMAEERGQGILAEGMASSGPISDADQENQLELELDAEPEEAE